jgi:hypothetical protein
MDDRLRRPPRVARTLVHNAPERSPRRIKAFREAEAGRDKDRPLDALLIGASLCSRPTRRDSIV